MKWLIDLIKFVIEDFKTDIQFIKRWNKGEIKWRYTIKQLLTINIKTILKEYYLWYIIIALSFCVGYYIATQNYQNACNEYIINNFIPNNQERLGQTIINLTN